MKLGLILGLITASTFPALNNCQIPVTGLQAIDSWLDPCHLHGNSTKTGEIQRFLEDCHIWPTIL